MKQPEIEFGKVGQHGPIACVGETGWCSGVTKQEAAENYRRTIGYHRPLVIVSPLLKRLLRNC